MPRICAVYVRAVHFVIMGCGRVGATLAHSLEEQGHDVAVIDRDDVLIAHTWNSAPLERVHGGPVRLVVPHLYFWKSAKWLRHITFLDEDTPGYWEVRGYHMRGDPWTEERYG